MSDLNWCTYCDSAINHFSTSLYCSEECLRSDALEHNPLLGYDYPELKNFLRSNTAPLRINTANANLTSRTSATQISPTLSPSLSSSMTSSVSSFKDVMAFPVLVNFDYSPQESTQSSVYDNIYQHTEKHQKIKPSIF